MNTLDQLINNYQKPLFFTGAGISTLSGLPDFTKPEYILDSDYMPRDILNYNFFSKKRNKKLFWNYCDDLHNQMINAKQSNGHQYINHIATKKETTIITQNIDGLHQPTNAKLIEIHGNIHECICLKCKKRFNYTKTIKTKKGNNRLSPCCHWQSKPDIILYNEAFDTKKTKEYQDAFQNSDICIVIGSSLGIPSHMDRIIEFDGPIVSIDKQITPLESYSGKREWDFVFKHSIQKILKV